MGAKGFAQKGGFLISHLDFLFGGGGQLRRKRKDEANSTVA